MMTGAMAFFAVGDALVKLSTDHFSTAQVILIMALPCTAIFAALTWKSGRPVVSRALLQPVVFARSIIEALTAVCMVSALSLAPMSLVISITQAVPLLVTLCAALILKERVGPRRWLAVLVGLGGVLLMLRPSGDGLAAGALLALGAASGLAARDIATRLTPSDVSTLQMATWGMGSLIPAALILFPFTPPHTPVLQWPLFIVGMAALATSAGYYAITAAMRIGEVSVVTPFRYSRLVFSLILAFVFLSERPDVLTLIGALIVIGSGLFVFWRERALANAAASPHETTRP